MSDSGDNQDSRRLRNMQGLLNFCTEITAREDTTAPSQISGMDPERRAFLEEALSGMTMNVAKLLAESVQKLLSEAVTMPEEDVTEQEEAIQQIEEHVDDLNHAMDFYKMGGFPALLRCLNSPHASLRVGAAGLIGDICQNNLVCQESMLSLKAIPPLLEMMDTDTDKQARIKALYAISCLIRDFPKGEESFLKADGLSYLMRSMQSGIEKLIVKSTFLLNNLVRNNESYIDTVLSMGYVEQLAVILGNEDTDNISREHCTAAVYGLASSYPQALQDALRPELGLPQVLRSRLSTISGKEEFQEEENHIHDLLNLFQQGDDDDEHR
ncbi:hsp70-binding protein 1-like [Penaeus indicus]|uniref:hsp70-binding protein 1-like n=1 Tax=Penaeus indicus TaxID=29960 RepID=UPI00300CC678